jgi:hypothetical protein
MTKRTASFDVAGPSDCSNARHSLQFLLRSWALKLLGAGTLNPLAQSTAPPGLSTSKHLQRNHQQNQIPPTGRQNHWLAIERQPSPWSTLRRCLLLSPGLSKDHVRFENGRRPHRIPPTLLQFGHTVAASAVSHQVSGLCCCAFEILIARAKPSTIRIGWCR